MQRELFGMPISQKSLSGFFSVTELVKAGNKWRSQHDLQLFDIHEYFKTQASKEFMEALEKKYGTVKINAKNKHSHTWVHPILFIDIALAISPTLKLEVYEWLYDNLLKYRNDSGDSYNKMTGVLFAHTRNKALFYKEIAEIANRIKKACNVTDWETATESQLKLRYRIEENIALLCDVLRNNSDAVRIGIVKAI